MGANRIPIIAAKRIADEYAQSQVVLVTFDKETGLTHVVTYGKTLEECKQAADGGAFVKRALGWPEALIEKSSKPKRMQPKKIIMANIGGEFRRMDTSPDERSHASLSNDNTDPTTTKRTS